MVKPTANNQTASVQRGSMRLLYLLVLYSLVVPSITSGASGVNTGCEYEIIPVHVQITVVRPVASSDFSKHEIRFAVLLTQDLPIRVENRVYGHEFLMLLRDKTFPGPQFIKKYEISPGTIFNSNYHLRKRGNCKPNFFEFPAINLEDYFERGLKG